MSLGGEGTWSKVKDVLRDPAVDKAIQEGQTTYLYEQLYEEQKKNGKFKK